MNGKIEQTRTVIAGGGFAGLYAAKYFETAGTPKKMWRSRSSAAKILFSLRSCYTKSQWEIFRQAISLTHSGAFFVT
jgi:hypothetical protein